MTTPDQVKQKILDAAVRDICSVSVAPAAKSEVRGILSTALDRYGEAVQKAAAEFVQKAAERAIDDVQKHSEKLIEQAAEMAVAQERERVREKLHSMYKPAGFDELSATLYHRMGYNLAIDDVLAALSTNTK